MATLKLRPKIYRLHIDFDIQRPKSSMHEIVLIAYNETSAREMASRFCNNEGYHIWRDKRKTFCAEIGAADRLYSYPQVLCRYVA